jgi:hypothetical protein
MTDCLLHLSKKAIGNVATRTGPVGVVADTSRRVVPSEKSDAVLVLVARNSGLASGPSPASYFSDSCFSEQALGKGGILDRDQETRTSVGVVAM